MQSVQTFLGMDGGLRSPAFRRASGGFGFGTPDSNGTPILPNKPTFFTLLFMDIALKFNAL